MASRASGQRRPREAGPSRTTMVEQVSGAPAPAAHSCPSAPSAPAPATPHPRQRTSSDLSLLVELAAAKMASVEAGASAEPVTEVRGGTHREVHQRKDSLLSRASVMDASTRKLLSSGAAEALGLGIICFFGCMGTLNGPLGIALPHIQVALTFGLVVMVAIACFAHISGAHFNPAVTLMSLIMRLIDIKTALVYFVSQCIGGTLGYGMLKVLTPNNLLYWGRAVGVNGTFEGAGPCCTVPHGGLSPAQAVLGELLGTAALLMLCCAVWDPRNAANTDGIPLKFGLLIAGVAMCLGPYTGASLNPARSLAPAIWEGTWTHHWVYWVGPLSAAVLLGYGWPILFAPVDEPAVKDKADMPLTLVSTDGKRHSRLADDDDAKLGY